MNEIKPGLSNSIIPQEKLTVDTKPTSKEASLTPDIEIDKNLQSLANMMFVSSDEETDHSRIIELKNKINNGSYKIDHEALSDKLFNQFLSTSKSI